MHNIVDYEVNHHQPKEYNFHVEEFIIIHTDWEVQCDVEENSECEDQLETQK